jgi:hypothetical protein
MRGARAIGASGAMYAMNFVKPREFVPPTAEGQSKVTTHPRTTIIGEHGRQSDAKREAARAGPCIDILAPERERLSTNRRRHRPATPMLVHLEQALDLSDSNLILSIVQAFRLSCTKQEIKKHEK